MSRYLLSHYIASMHSPLATTPAMLDEASILRLVTTWYKHDIPSYEDMIEASLPSLFIYDIPEGKSEFNIETIRVIISEMSLSPYDETKQIYILRHFDTASHAAQNAFLKTLEEPPPYAVILLEVSNPNNILETIQSRTVNLVETHQSYDITPWVTEMVEAYRAGDRVRYLSSLYKWKGSREEAITLMTTLIPYLSGDRLIQAADTIEILYDTYESPRNILDTFFL